MKVLIMYLIQMALGILKFIEIWGPCVALVLLILTSITLLTKDKSWFMKLIMKVSDF